MWNHWYPFVQSSRIKPGKIYAETLLGRPLVLFRDETNRVRCLHDACPHQGSPLSTGRIVEGRVECGFHGWQFNGDGVCEVLPSWPARQPLPKNARCRFAYPTEEFAETIWVWMGAPEAPTPLERPEHVGDEGWTYNMIVKDCEVPHEVIVAGTLDYTHLQFLHRNTLGNKYPLVFPVRTQMVDEPGGYRVKILNDQSDSAGRSVSFRPSCFVQHAVTLADPESRLLFNEYMVPLDARRTRLFMYITRNWKIRNPMVSMGLIKQTNAILDEDIEVARGQSLRHLSGDGSWECLVPQDQLCSRYLQWFKKNKQPLISVLTPR